MHRKPTIFKYIYIILKKTYPPNLCLMNRFSIKHVPTYHQHPPIRLTLKPRAIVKHRQSKVLDVVCSKKEVKLKRNLVKRISYDIVIDACFTASTYLNTDTSLIVCASVFANALCNDIVLNVISNLTTNFLGRCRFLFTIGLLTNVIGAVIYSQPFTAKLFLKYILTMALSMSILTNLRYSVVKHIEYTYEISNMKSFTLRLFNNTLGNMQYYFVTFWI